MPGACTGHLRIPGYLAVAAIVLAACLDSAGAAIRDTPILGDPTIEASSGFSAPGQAEAFRATASQTAQVSTVNVYVDSGSAAITLRAGIYTDAGGHPGSLLGQGSVAAKAGAWNAVSLASPVSLTVGPAYWIAILGPAGGGSLGIRDARAGGTIERSAETSLNSLPGSWTTGQRSWE